MSISYSPGPAAYSPSGKNKEGITIPKSHRETAKHVDNQSFVTGNMSSLSKGPSYSIPKSKSNDKMETRGPGPADYSPKSGKEEKYK